MNDLIVHHSSDEVLSLSEATREIFRWPRSDALFGRGTYDWTVGNLGSANTALPYHAGLAQHAPKRLRYACTFRICCCSFQVSHPGKSRDPMMLTSIIPLCERDFTRADMAHAPVVIDLKFALAEPREQPWAYVPVSLKGEA